jgi:peptidyl-prolyl cis-trans isomerase B (cyclophilin B)
MSVLWRRWPWVAAAAVLLLAAVAIIVWYPKSHAPVRTTAPPSRPSSATASVDSRRQPGLRGAPAVPCDFRPADSAGQPRLVPTPGPQATLTGPVPATIATTLGDLEVQLDGAKAPCSVHSFVHLAKQDFYADTECHRLTTSGIWVLQCGDPTGTGTGSPGYQFGEENLPNNGIPAYPRGTLAMANAGPGTNGSQFFIVYRDSDIPPVYSVFGTVTSGLDLLERVAAAGTDDGSADGRPKLAVRITEVRIPS